MEMVVKCMCNIIIAMLHGRRIMLGLTGTQLIKLAVTVEAGQQVHGPQPPPSQPPPRHAMIQMGGLTPPATLVKHTPATPPIAPGIS